MLTAAQVERETAEGFGNEELIPALGPRPEWFDSGHKLPLPGTEDRMERASFVPVEFQPQTALIHDPPPRDVPLEMLTSSWEWRWFQMGGWVYHNVTTRMQREDQGQDFEVPLGHHIIAPGWGKCVHHLSDAPFPNGFGSPYAVVYLPPQRNCRFAGHFWYLGHDNGSPIIQAGEWFHAEATLSTPNHSLNPGWGWTELGVAPGGFPGAFGNGTAWHWAFSPVKKWSAF